MSLFDRMRSAARRAASNVYSGARQLPSAVVPEPIQSRNWLSGNVETTQIPQVLDEITEHVGRNCPPRPLFDIRDIASALGEFTRVYTVNGTDGVDARRLLKGTRQNITNVLRDNRGTKVNLVFRCNMENKLYLGQLYNHPLFIPILRII